MQQNGPELFIGLAGAIGTDLDLVFDSLEANLSRFGYDTTKIHLAGCLREMKEFASIPLAPIDEYANQMMDAGDKFRRQHRSDAVALLGIGKIKDERKRLLAGSGAGGESSKKMPVGCRAYVFKSLKNPKEATSLRQIYGSNFYLVAAYSPRDQRLASITNRIASDRGRGPTKEDRESAEELVERDRVELAKMGQNLQDTFHLADCFVDASDPERVDSDIKRFAEIAFGHPFRTPTRAEYVMFHAQAAALRSAEPGRQVGAVIANDDADIIAVGCNEIPRAGGGLAWCDDLPDRREHTKRFDTSDAYKRTLLAEMLKSLSGGGWLVDSFKGLDGDQLADKAISGERPVIPKRFLVRNIIEYGRAVHAEMAAIDDAARRGVSIKNCTMYVTTYPCHLCARHIIAAGLKSVKYIEPYPRSLAAEFYPEAIVDEPCGPLQPRQAAFEPFLGIAPRMYLRAFTAPVRKEDSGALVQFDPHSATPRWIAPEPFYLEREDAELFKLDSTSSKGLD